VHGGLILKKEEILLKRVEELIQKASEVRKTETITRTVRWFDMEFFVEWKTNSLSFLERNFYQTPYYNSFSSGVGANVGRSVESGLGVLKALKEDIEKGYLTRHRTLVIADVFSDFLNMAEHLYENNYIHPSVSLVGAVLENGLRKICDNHNITVKSNDNISSLNKKLADNEIYTRIVQGQIEVWKKIRDYADHGHFDKYTKEEVESMLKGVSKFLSGYFK